MRSRSCGPAGTSADREIDAPAQSRARRTSVVASAPSAASASRKCGQLGHHARRGLAASAPPSRAAATRSASTSAARSNAFITCRSRRRAGRSALVEHGFEVVREPTSASKPKAPAPPLIECTARKTALMVSPSASPLLHRGQPLFHGGELLLAFLEEGLLMDSIGSMTCRPIARSRGRRHARMAATSFSGSNGLTIQPVAPASRARASWPARFRWSAPGSARCGGARRRAPAR